MSSLWDVPQYLIMAFSLALDAPVEKASRVSFSSPPHAEFATPRGIDAVPSEAEWLRAMKSAAAYSDILQSYASRIFVTSAGRYYVPTAAERTDILALRSNGEVAVRVYAAATQTLREDLRRRSGVEPTRGALLVAHLLGRDTALAYLRALERDPAANARKAVPALASLIASASASLSLEQIEVRLAQSTRAGATEVAAGQTGRGLKGTLTRPEDLDASAQVAAR